MVRRCRLHLQSESGELIRIAFLYQPRELRCTRFFDFLEVESPGLLAEAQHALDFVFFGLVEVTSELFEFRLIAAIEGGKPSRELLARRSFKDFDGGGLRLSRSVCTDGQANCGECDARQKELTHYARMADHDFRPPPRLRSLDWNQVYGLDGDKTLGLLQANWQTDHGTTVVRP